MAFWSVDRVPSVLFCHCATRTFPLMLDVGCTQRSGASSFPVELFCHLELYPRSPSLEESPPENFHKLILKVSFTAAIVRFFLPLCWRC